MFLVCRRHMVKRVLERCVNIEPGLWIWTVGANSQDQLDQMARDEQECREGKEPGDTHRELKLGRY